MHLALFKLKCRTCLTVSACVRSQCKIMYTTTILPFFQDLVLGKHIICKNRTKAWQTYAQFAPLYKFNDVNYTAQMDVMIFIRLKCHVVELGLCTTSYENFKGSYGWGKGRNLHEKQDIFCVETYSAWKSTVHQFLEVHPKSDVSSSNNNLNQSPKALSTVRNTDIFRN